MENPSDRISVPPDKKKKSTASIALATFLMIVGLTLSKGTGFLRENFIMEKFGSGTLEADAFILGFTIPDLFFQLLVGGSIQAAITPSLARAVENGQQRRGWKSVSTFITLIALIMLVFTILGSLLSDWILPLFYFDKDVDMVALAAKASRALFPQVFFMMLAAFCIGILNAYKKFSSTAFGPTIYNIFVVLAIFFLGGKSEKGVIYAALGITVSAGVYFLWQFYMARSELRNYRVSLAIHDEGFKELLHLAVPTMLSASIVQLNTIIVQAFTGDFDKGIIQSLSNSKTIWQIPYGIFAVAVGSVMLPSLSAHFAARDYKSARMLFGKSLRNALFLTIPSAGLLFALSYDVVPALFKWSDAYNTAKGQVTSMVLMGYCIAIIAQTFVFIYNQAFYAIGNTRVPLATGALSMVLITLFCSILKALGMLSSTNSAGALWLSLTYSITSVISALVLFSLYRKNMFLAPKHLAPFMVRSAICTAFMLLLVYTMNVLPIHPAGKIVSLLWLAARGMIGFAGYFAAAKAMNMRELTVFLDKILGKIRSKRRGRA